MEKGAELADGVSVGPLCVIGGHVRVGEGTRLINSVTLMGHTAIGRDNLIYPYSVLGAPPQDLKYKGGDTLLEIGDANTIREHVTINVGTENGGGRTRVGSNNLLMCACHVAHDCNVADGCIISNNVLLAGHVHVGDSVVLSGSVGVHHFVTIGEYAFVGGLSRIVRDVPPFLMTEGRPAAARAINLVGLRRNGFSREAVAALEAAFKAIFRSGEPMASVLDEIEAAAPSKEVSRLVAFLRARANGKRGRAMQP